MEISQKIINRIAIGSSNSTPGHLSAEEENINLKRFMISEISQTENVNTL